MSHTNAERNAGEGSKAMSGFDPGLFTANMAKAGEIWQEIVQRIMMAQMHELEPRDLDPLKLQEAWARAVSSLASDPSRWVKMQTGMWQDYMQFWAHMGKRMLGHEDSPYIAPDERDRRFQDKAWNESLFFDAIKQSYLLASKWMRQSVDALGPMDKQTASKLNFFARQCVDALSPTNFLFTNPEVLRVTFETNGENLVKGLENLLRDIKRGHGELHISTADEDAFTLGENIACTPGEVIYENDLMQLIQYAPATKEVYKTPLLIIPAWINKYYILDLQPKNSFIRWAVEQGHTVFVISWVNPDAALGRKGFDDYLREGPLAALEAIEKATGETKVNAIGYCLGGTLLAITLAYLQAKGKANRIASATYFTTMIDFSNAGDLSVFIDESQLRSLEERMSEKGYLGAQDMADTFSMLRANDMIWSFVINNYLLGKDPFPFDILYWNADSTRMPAVMHSFYLRNMYHENRLIRPGGIEAAGEPVNLRTLTTPSYILATREDHIAPWESVYVATQLYHAPMRFVLAESGHVAGVVNPPEKQKYGYWVNDALPGKATNWLGSAEHHKGSWWSDWETWIADYAGGTVAARKPGGKKLKPIEPAPGHYAKTHSE